MLWQLSPGVIAEFTASAILLLLAIYFPWRDLSRQARLTGVTLIFVCALWMLSNAIEIGLPVASYKEFLVGAQLVLGAIALTLWLFYILHYLGPKKLLSPRIFILFGIMPLIAIVALSTNNAYGLMWTEIGLDSQNPYLPLQPTYGIVYWACMVYLAMLTLTGSFIISWSIFHRRYSYSRESIFLLLAAVLPVITAFIEVMGLPSSLKLPIGLSPWAGCIGAVILILNLPRFHTEQVIPIARDVIFERIGDCIIVLDLQDRVLDLNPEAEQLIGYTISDAFGLPIERIWSHQSNPPMPFNKIAEAGEKLVLERDGKQRTYDLRISAINDSGGRHASKVVLLTDITERKQAEETLRSKQILLGRTEGIAHVGSWEWDIVSDTVTWSDELFRIFQRDPLEGAPSFAEQPVFFHAADFKILKQAVEVAVAAGTPYELELRVIRKDGETRVCVARGVAEIAPGGRTVRLFGSLQDITERKQAEEKLKQSRDLITNLARLVPGVIYQYRLYLDGRSAFPYSSPGMNDIYEVTPEEVREDATAVFGRLHPDDYDCVADSIQESARTLQTFYCEFRVILPRQGLRWRWSQAHPERMMDGGTLWHGIISDITERKLSEEKLAISYESVKKTLTDAINTMVKIVELRDPYTAGHQQKVADLATAIAGEMKLDDSCIEQLRTAAVIHDIGKMYVPSDILSKPGKLGDIEFSLIKTHAQSGYDIVKGMDFPGIVAEAVLQHHERLDGSGYPNGLKGEDTLLVSKILAVADVVEAMASHRPYRQALGIDKALEEVAKNRGKLYDPGVVDACLELYKSGRFEFNSV